MRCKRKKIIFASKLKSIMKVNYIIASLSLSVVLFASCNKEEKKEVVEKAELNNIQVSLDLTIKKDDSLQVFYKDEAIVAFGEENSVIVAVKGSTSQQEVIFNLPEEITPTELRFDIGNKEGQEPIVLNDFKMKYKEKVYSAKDSTMLYFAPNDQLTYDAISKTLTHKKISGQPYDPFIYSTPILAKQVKNLYKK